MPKTANLNIRIDPQTKKNSEQLFASFGLTVSEAVNVFLHKSLIDGGLPFMVQRDFNTETIEALEDVRQQRNLQGPYKTAKAAIKAMLD